VDSGDFPSSPILITCNAVSQNWESTSVGLVSTSIGQSVTWFGQLERSVPVLVSKKNNQTGIRSDFNTADQPADATFHQACTPQAHPGCAYPAESTIYGPLSRTYQSNPNYHTENLNDILNHTSFII